MIIALFAHLYSVIIDLLSMLGRSEREKDLEIVLLRQQIRILQRTRARPPRLSWCEKMLLALLATKLVQGATNARARLSQSLVLFPPEAVLRWHRELVRQKLGFFPSASHRKAPHWGGP